MDNIITITANMSAKLNYAFVQNYIPVLRSIRLTNNTAETISDITLKISFEPEFAKPYEQHISALEPERTAEISPVDITVSGEFLYAVTETLTANVTLSIEKDGQTISEANGTIELMPLNQWTGVNYVPEMISAFVCPNHPMVTQIVGKAASFLQKWTGSPSFDGYQSKNPNVVKKQAAAIYAALQAENIAYSMPPAGFEKQGQRVRLPWDVLTAKTGTCLDLSVLYASCLEAAGLNSLILFTQGHAFAGVWLEDQSFSGCTEEDPSLISKRMAAGIDQICLVECTAFTAGKSVDFDGAKAAAEALVHKPEEFEMAVDIARCRGNCLRPVPVMADGVAANDFGKRKDKDITAAPKDIDLSISGRVSDQSEQVTRQTMWERKLLDLSLRNSLLNFRPTASVVRFITADLPTLEDTVCAGGDMKILPLPEDMSLEAADAKTFEMQNPDTDRLGEIAKSELEKSRLRSFLKEAELEKAMKKLHRQAKVSLEENGANTLYLALGFLKWFETDKSEQPRYAPIVLVPVDLVKKIQEKCYVLRVRDEEPQMNITLLEFLRQDLGITISGLDPLPRDESGVDLPLVFNTLRQGVMSLKRWDIIEQAFLGQFSFNRFIMWNDIRNRSEELRQNKVVSSLISGTLGWQPMSTDVSPRQLDEQVRPSDMAVPMSADSSQLAAIYLASKGESFVLHGPPGTGKSQTITNLIANALYNGKSVLFVAEKMAALSVVQKRLAKIGLDPFCLEIHSNKATKREVLSQLEKTFEVGHVKSPAEYQAQAKRVGELRDSLNEIITQLHMPRACGMSVYQSVVNYENNKQFKGAVTVDGDFAAACSPQTLEKIRDSINSLAVCGREIGGLENSGLKYYKNPDYSVEIRTAFETALKYAAARADEAQTAFDELCALVGVKLEGSKRNITDLGEFAKTLSCSGEFLPAVLNDPSAAADAQCKMLIDELNGYKTARAQMRSLFEDSVLSFDSDNALLEWNRAAQKWALGKSMGQNKLVKELRVYAKDGNYVTKDNYVDIVRSLSDLKKLYAHIDSLAGAKAAFAGLYNGENSDTARMAQLFENSVKLRGQIADLSRSDMSINNAFMSFAAGYAAGDPRREKLDNGAQAIAKMKQSISSLSGDFTLDLSYLDQSTDYIPDLKDTLNDMQNDLGSLRDRTMLTRARNALLELGLDDLDNAYENGEVNEDTILPAFECAFAQGVIVSVMNTSPALASFQGVKLEETIKKYTEADEKFKELTVAELVAKLSANIPDPSNASKGSSELSILLKAIKSGGRNMPIRKLFDSIPTLLRRICPCMLMSPISVAQYIDPKFPRFDLVVFDEASQMPTSEAVGAIARGDNVIVVGDPKQLPPTTFFDVNRFDEENEEAEDLESVLDDCLALSMPSKHLLWHYRSRHESLIAYSNAKYYDNKLLTFPSPDDRVSKVSWVHLEGYYDKGSSKQNKAEAQAIVDEIVRRLKDEKLRCESIGVVTFSVVQQVLIDDMLSDRLREEPKLEEYADSMYEPILIKNLENVQGDERDVILFSVGYGPDKDGKVSMNFGPVNRDGGWRRLNVAISRARKQMIVYSVIRPEQIDLSRTRSEGVEGLKGFIEFAARGQSALPVRLGQQSACENGFVKLVADEIEKMGYKTKTNIGCSEYKIDIGVISPDNEEEYFMGISCMGDSNLEKTTARDRSVLQPSVLKGLGWRMYNVNILDWYDNKDKVLEKLKAQIETDLALYREPTPEQPEPQKAKALEFEKEESVSVSDKCPAFEEIALKKEGKPSEFVKPGSEEKAVQQISQVINAMAPVSSRHTMKIVLAAWGIATPKPEVQKAFFGYVNKCGVKVTSRKNDDGTFDTYYWRADQDPDSYDLCRIPKGGKGKRSFPDVSPQELTNAMLLILNDQVSMTHEDLVKECTTLFGFARTADNIDAQMTKAIEYAVESGKMRIENGRLFANA
ncbi:DUF4011 domain-containing protein [Ruminococcus sp. FC2018]|uniref:DUF4011 domain-containing protein n=1 Tax=Ruminococcus sp. FC2018 TaxID=1410617 RepID=UPI00048A87FC|nr:DUF4011 domain-containing protein [Ruminococcus sp. FC2018]